MTLAGPRVPFFWGWLARKLAVLLREGEAPRRVVAEAAIRISLFGTTQAGWLADEVVAPGWRRARFSGPLFILGHQRSGTTFLHRLLAEDERFYALKLHEQLLPAVTLQRGLAALGAFDRARLGGRLSARLSEVEERLFSPLDDIHRLRFSEIEEDEFVLWGLFASAMAANDTPRAAASAALDGLRDFDGWPRSRQRQALGYYRAVLTKAAHRRARPGRPAPWIVAKNPAFTHKVAALQATFPGARFVHLHRDPVEAIPSRLSLIRAIWRRRVPGFTEMSRAQVETVLRDSVRTYRAAWRNAQTLGPDALVVVDYRSLREDPAGEVRRTLARLGLGAPDAELTARLDALRPAPPSGHRYALEEFGLTREDLAARLGEAAAPPPDPG